MLQSLTSASSTALGLSHPAHHGQDIDLEAGQHIPLQEFASTSGAASLPGSMASQRARIVPGKAAATKETLALEARMAQVGMSKEAFEALIPPGGRFVPSASYGKPVASLNDHVGIIVFPQINRGVRIAEMLAVVKDTVTVSDGPGEPRQEERYFVKGYGNRLVGMESLMAFDPEAYEPKKSDDPSTQPTRMETSFRSHLYRLSQQSTLCARGRLEESDRVVMPLPPHARPLPRIDTWANGEQFLHGFGPRARVAVDVPVTAGEHAEAAAPKAVPPPTVASDFQIGYVDYNDTENRLIFFLAGEPNHANGRPTQEREGKTVPASVNPDGPILAQIQGIRKVEVVGPAGEVAGVKMASLRRPFTRADEDKELRITTEDNAVHGVRFTADGIKMNRILPKPAPQDAMTSLDDADISLYFYQGRNTGPAGSPEGYADPELVMSTGEALKASTLTTDPTTVSQALASAGRLAAELFTLSPRIGNNPGVTSAILNTTARAAVTGGAVFGMSALLNVATKHFGGTLLPGAHSFTASGAGEVSPGQLGRTVAAIVPVQTLLTHIMGLVYENLPAEYKQKESVVGQAINEFAVPFLGEATRLMANYGLEKGFGLPRGDGIDAACLLLTAALQTGVKLLRERSGQPENHPLGDKIGIALQFFLGDLAGRALGAAASDPHRQGPISAANYGEAYLSRMITRGYDKAVAPVLASWLNHAGVSGENAGAYDTQLNRENRFNGMLGGLRSLSHDITVAMDGYIAAAGDKLAHDIELTATPVTAVRKWAHHLHQATDTLFTRARDTNEQDLAAIREAVRYPTMTAPEQQAYRAKLKERTERRVAASAGEATPDDAAVLPIYNNLDELPADMKQKISALMDGFLALYPAGPGAPPPAYSTGPSPDFLSPSLPYDAQASVTLGAKTRRIQQAITTFTREPVSNIKEIHDILANSPGMPQTPADSLPHYAPLTEAVLRQHWEAEVKYTIQSGPFHYKLRWNDTGQPHYTEVVPGVPIKTTRMNRRGNVTGDGSMQVSGRDALLINLGALHGVGHAGPLMRAVVSEAAYLQPDQPGGQKTVKAGEYVSLTEIFSTTNSSLLAAAFLAPQGYNAAAGNRRARLVIDSDGHEPVAVQIAAETELKQAETVIMPGANFVVSRVVAEPVKPPVADGAQPKENLGQVIHLKRVNLWQQEVKFRKLSALIEQKVDLSQYIVTDARGTRFAHGDLELLEGERIVAPGTGNFFEVSLQNGTVERNFIRNKNYFLGTDLEGGENDLGRTRHPYTSEKSTRGVRDEINEMLLLEDPAVPFLNDMTRNVAYEVDKRAGGYYNANNPYRKADEQALAEMRGQAAKVAAELNALTMTQQLPASKIGKGQPFPGQLLAEITASALRQPLRMIAVGADGKVVMEPGKDDAVVVCDINKGFDKVDMTYDKQGHTMIGVGPHGYYSLSYKQGALKATPVRISDKGHTPGNLLHAIAAGALPNPNGSRYVEKDGVLKTATEDQLHPAMALAGMPGSYPGEEILFDTSVNQDITALLQKLKNYAGADYIPMQQWLGARAAQLGKPSAGKQQALPPVTQANVTAPAARDAAALLGAHGEWFAGANNAASEDGARIKQQGQSLASEFQAGRPTQAHEEAMTRNVALARVTLGNAGLATAPASGAGANCLIHSILDQLDVPAGQVTALAAEIRTELIDRLAALGIPLEQNEYLESFGPHVAHLVDIVNQRYPLADTAVRIYVPMEDGGLVAVNGAEENGRVAQARAHAVAVMWVGQHYEPIKSVLT